MNGASCNRSLLNVFFGARAAAQIAIATILYSASLAALDHTGPLIGEQAAIEISPRARAYFVLSGDSASHAPLIETISVEYGISIEPNEWYIDSLGATRYQFSSESQRTEKIIANLAADERVNIAGRNEDFQLAGTRAQDPYFPLQHALATTRVDESHRIATGKDVKIAVIDTGVDRQHVDLRSNIDLELNFVDVSPTTTIVEFHATAVAGIIGADGDNGQGILGVAPESRMYILRACNESIPGDGRGQCNSFALARALDWSIINNIKVINMSLQGKPDALVTRLINKAVDNGAIIVAATELIHGQLAYPASLDNVIAVSDEESNSLVGLAAHSQRIFIAPGEEVLTTMPDNSYDFVTGASFATAHVTGIIGLLVEVSPQISASEVMQVLRKSVRIVNWGIMVDSCAALELVSTELTCRDLNY